MLTKQYNNLHSRPITGRDQKVELLEKINSLVCFKHVEKKAIYFVVFEDGGVVSDLCTERILLKKLMVNFRMLAKWDTR